MRFALCISLLALTACNSVKFSPEEVPATPVTPPPLQCLPGDSAWLPAGIGTTQCATACPDGSYLQCQTTLEKEVVCADNSMGDSGRTRIASVGSPIGSCPVIPPPSSKPVTEEFDAPPRGKADILVVLDTTPSMSPELTKLSKRFASLTRSLGDVDWQIAVTNAGASGGWLGSWDAQGQFFTFEDHPQNKTVLKNGDADVDYYFQNTVGSEDDEVKWDDNGRPHVCDFQPYCMSSHPKPIESVKKAIDLRTTKNKGFFRKDAWLVPLMISDADEDEYGGSGAMLPQTLVNYYNSTLGSTMKGILGFGIVIKPGDEKCRHASDSLFSVGKFGTFVTQFAQQTGGLTMSICDTDYSNGLGQISDRVREKMTSIDLSQDPVSSEITVTVTPAVAGLTWTRVGRKITFNKPLPAGAKVKITYKVKN